MERKKSDQELEDILEKLNESEKHALRFGLIPKNKTPDEMTGKDVARLMELNPKKSF